MAAREIRLFGDPVLRTPSEPGVGLRVFTYQVDGELGHTLGLGI